MLSDGYGDELLAAERLLRLQVAERAADPGLWDDLLNEARLALWRAASARPEASPAYLHAVTRNRISELLRQQNWTGHTRVHGQPTDPLRQPGTARLGELTPELITETDAWVDGVLLGYHSGEILAAVQALPERHRAYVLLRFWGGWTAGEIAPVIGVKATNQARMWNEAIRPRLARQLANLAD